MKLKVRHYIILAVMLILSVGLIVGNVICYRNAQAITNLLCGSGIRFDGEDFALASAAGDALVQNVCDEGIVMLKNEGGEDGKGVLPLPADVTKLNLFGGDRRTKASYIRARAAEKRSYRERRESRSAKGLRMRVTNSTTNSTGFMSNIPTIVRRTSPIINSRSSSRAGISIPTKS